MRQQLRHQLWIILVGLIVYMTNLGGARLFDMDEALYATCAREMVERGDWVTPWFNGELFPEKPPLMFWCMMLGTAVFGATEFAVRVPSVFFAIATGLTTYHLGRWLYRAEVGFWAGIITLTSLIFTVSARAATVDAALTFAITFAIAVVVAGGTRHAEAKSSEKFAPRDFLPRRWWQFALIYAAVGVAVLAKGPVGAVMVVGVLGLFLLMVPRQEASRPGALVGFIKKASWEPALAARLILPWWLVRLSLKWSRTVGQFLLRFNPKRIFLAGWALRPITAIAMVSLVAAPWYYLVWQRTEGQWIYQFLAKYNLGPAAAPIQGHSGPIYYHLLLVFVGFFPWSVFIGPMLVEMVARLKKNDSWRVGYILAASWTVAIMGLWSLVALKLPHHILPAYPALALLAAPFVYSWITEPQRINRIWMRNATVSLISVGVCILAVVPIVTWFFLPGEAAICLIGLPLLFGGIACWKLSRAGKTVPTMVAFTTTAIVFLISIFGFATLRVDRHQNAPYLAEMLQQTGDWDQCRLASYGHFRESFVHYTGGPVRRLHSEEDIRTFLTDTKNDENRSYLITTDRDEEKIRQEYPGRLEVVLRRPKFLKKGKLIVLRPANTPEEEKPSLTARRPVDETTPLRK